jgi:hypothetical protein
MFNRLAGTENDLVSGCASGSGIRIRILSDPKHLAGSVSGKNHSGSRSKQFRIRNEFEGKLLRQLVKLAISQQNAQFKNVFSLLSKKYSPEKLTGMSRQNKQPNTGK